MNGTLPRWGAEHATEFARSQLSRFARMVSFLTGEANNPWIGNDARRTILKIYSVCPLKHVKWNIMNTSDLATLKALRYDSGQGLDLTFDLQWLQMVVPPQVLQYLRAKRDDGVFESSRNWWAKESPI